MMRRLIPVVVLAVVVACGSDSTTQPTAASVAGTWSLQTVNGSPLPFTLTQTGTDKLELLSDVVTAQPNGTYTEVVQFRTTVGGQATTSSNTDSGTFTINGTAVVLSSAQTGSTTGQLSGNTLTLADQGYVWVFVKQ